VKIAYGLPFLQCPPNPAFLSSAALGELATLAEDLGFAAVYLTEHPIPGENWRQAGGHDALDPLVGLSFVGAQTRTIRLLTNLVVLPYRNPFLLAKSAAAVDVLSEGRLELGLGTGYQKAEFFALGVDFDERNALFDEAITVMRLAWTGEPLSYSGIHFSARDVTSQPPPAQPGGPPLWFGGNSKLTRRRVVDYDAGWMPMPTPRAAAKFVHTAPLETIDDLAVAIDGLRHYAREQGKPEPTRIMWVLPNLDPHDVSGMKASADDIKRLADIGVTWCQVNGQGSSMAEAKEFLQRYADVLSTG
jgi:probable F420-dependent oxidoreductase